MAPSWLQIVIVVLLLVLLFGRGKISELMGDVAKGIKSFKRGMAQDDDDPKTIEHQAADVAATKDASATSKKAG